MDEKEYLEKLQRVGIKLKGLRYTIRGCLGFGLPLRDKVFEKQGQFIGQLQRGRQQNQSGVPSPPSGRQQPQVMERFSNRPRLIDFLQQSQEPQQPQLTEEERIILQERELQLLEDAERRSKEEMREKEVQEQVEGLKRARERMSIENLR